jgi:hypothetical protein
MLDGLDHDLPATSATPARPGPHYTPGPWNFHRYFQPLTRETSHTTEQPGFEHLTISIAKGEKLLGEAWMFKPDPDYSCGYPRVQSVDEVIGNAKLMVAAPEMAELLLAIYRADRSGASDKLVAVLEKAGLL